MTCRPARQPVGGEPARHPAGVLEVGGPGAGRQAAGRGRPAAARRRGEVVEARRPRCPASSCPVRRTPQLHLPDARPVAALRRPSASAVIQSRYVWEGAGGRQRHDLLPAGRRSPSARTSRSVAVELAQHLEARAGGRRDAATISVATAGSVSRRIKPTPSLRPPNSGVAPVLLGVPGGRGSPVDREAAGSAGSRRRRPGGRSRGRPTASAGPSRDRTVAPSSQGAEHQTPAAAATASSTTPQGPRPMRRRRRRRRRAVSPPSSPGAPGRRRHGRASPSVPGSRSSSAATIRAASG